MQLFEMEMMIEGLSAQEEMDLMADKVIEYYKKLKSDCRAKVIEREEILSELGYNIKTDMPLEVHKRLEEVATNEIVTSNEVFGLDEQNTPDYVHSILAHLDVSEQEISLKKQISYVDTIIRELEKDGIHLKRELERSQKEVKVEEEKAIEASIKSTILHGKMKRYTSELERMKPSQEILSKYMKIKDLKKKTEEKKEKIAEIESNLKKYRGLPPNINEAEALIAKMKKEADDLKKQEKRLGLNEGL